MTELPSATVIAGVSADEARAAGPPGASTAAAARATTARATAAALLTVLTRRPPWPARASLLLSSCGMRFSPPDLAFAILSKVHDEIPC